MKINRNDECWCNSGLKYKKCHMEFDEKLKSLKERGFEVPSHNIIKTKEQIEKIKESAKINNAVLDLVAENIKAGMTTEEIDKLVTAIEEAKPDVEFDVDEITTTPQDYVELEGDDMMLFERLMDLLDDCDDVDQIFHNVSNYDDGEE